jgi:hypothetical protein
MINAIVARTLDEALQGKYEFFMAKRRFPDAFLFHSSDMANLRSDPKAAQFFQYNPGEGKGWELDGTPVYVRY